MERQTEERTKLLLFFSAGLIAYSLVEITMGEAPTLITHKRAWCDAGLCPEEFSEQRLFALIQESATKSNPEANEDLRRALILDSASPYNWANLGDAEMNDNYPDQARYCFRRAVAAAPLNPFILFRAANFDFQTGDQDGTLSLLRTVLNDPGLASYYEPAFLTYSRLDVPLERVLEEGVPKTQPVAAAFLRYWMDGKKLPESQTTWAWMTHNSLANDQIASDYVAFLIQNNAPEDAAGVWKKYTIRHVPDYRKTNWVFDGDFAREPSSSPLDWSI